MSKNFSKQIRKIFSFTFLTGLLILIGFYLISFPPNFLLESKVSKLNLPTPPAYPKNSSGIEPPVLTARSVVIIDVDSGVELLQKDSKISTAPASTTKIMTALISLENYKLDHVLEVNGLKEIEGQKMKLVPNEKISVESLLYGLLVGSANDAALVLAENFPNGEEGFIWAMNQKAKELNLTGTHFTNPVGYDEEGHYSTASDLAKLAIFAMKNPEFSKIVGTEKMTIFDIEGKISHQLTNVNALVGKLDGVKGVKTGWTQQAGECLITFIERDRKRIVIAILGSQDRFVETQNLVNWVFTNFTWESPLY